MRIGTGFCIEPQGARDGVDDLGGRVADPTLLQTEVVVTADPGNEGDLLASQTGNPAEAIAPKAYVAGTDLLTTSLQEFAELRRARPLLGGPRQGVTDYHRRSVTCCTGITPARPDPWPRRRPQR
jgi:hypothetical protein